MKCEFLAQEFSILICCYYIGFWYCAIHGISVLSNYLQPMSLTKTKTQNYDLAMKMEMQVTYMSPIYRNLGHLNRAIDVCASPLWLCE